VHDRGLRLGQVQADRFQHSGYLFAQSIDVVTFSADQHNEVVGVPHDSPVLVRLDVHVGRVGTR
jgi:hypothetical protein